MTTINRTGFAPGNINRKDIELYQSTVIIPPDTVLQNIPFFQSLNGRNGRYQNFFLPSPTSQHTLIHAMAFEHKLVFTGASTAAIRINQAAFETHSYIQWKRSKMAYAQIPLNDLLPYNHVIDGDTLVLRSKFKEYFELPEPIEVGGGTDFSIELQVQNGLTTGASAKMLGFLPDSGMTLTGNLGGYVRLKVWASKIEGAQ